MMSYSTNKQIITRTSLFHMICLNTLRNSQLQVLHLRNDQVQVLYKSINYSGPSYYFLIKVFHSTEIGRFLRADFI